MLGVGDALRADPRVFVYGEDVGGNYGNAFLLLRPLAQGVRRSADQLAARRERRAGRLCRRRDRRAATDRRDAVQRLRRHRLQSAGEQRGQNAIPVGRQFGVPMVVRMPWGGLRHAGPYHSQNTEAWFYRTAGLKIVVPSTPHDARALMASAVADPDPVLYYEHIALYRDPRIKQTAVRRAARRRSRSGRAALRRAGDDLAIISYGAFVHTGMRVAAKLAHDGIEASVLDLRSLVPLDRARCPRGRAPLPQGADHPRGLANRRHWREPCRDHSGRSLRSARRAHPHRRRARHAGAVFAVARGVLSAERRADRACRAAADRVLTSR